MQNNTFYIAAVGRGKMITNSVKWMGEKYAMLTDRELLALEKTLCLYDDEKLTNVYLQAMASHLNSSIRKGL